MKPILFNTEMVRAIQANRKTVTRRVVKPQPEGSRDILDCDEDAHTFDFLCGNGEAGGIFADWVEVVKAPYWTGDILYVRETWRIWRAHRYDADAHIEFKAGGEEIVLRFPYGYTDSANRDDYDSFIGKWGVCGGWHPSIHMPREAARIFLRVTDVRMERLQDITEEQARAEGAILPLAAQNDPEYAEYIGGYYNAFEELWDSTIKPADRTLYGCDANPWVWIIEFERITKEEATHDV